ncbi:MAG: hypothetical protein AAGD12_10495 [Pseudomonadota bacterium]
MTCETWQDLQCLSTMARTRARSGRFTASIGLIDWPEGGIAADISQLDMPQAASTLLIDLARDSGVHTRRCDLFAGRRGSAANTAHLPGPVLRRPWGSSAMVDGTDVSLAIAGARHWPECLAQAVREGSLRGATGRPFRTILHCSDKGAKTAARGLCKAAAAQRSAPNVAFLASEDARDLPGLLAKCNPAETLAVFAYEDLASAEARQLVDPVTNWLRDAFDHASAQAHLVAVTGSTQAAFDLDLAAERVIAAGPEWLAGYSVWSPVNLGLLIALGADGLSDLRAGGWDADRQFRDSADEANLALLLGCADVWRESVFGRAGDALPLGPAGWDGIELALFAGQPDRLATGILTDDPRGLECDWCDLELLRFSAALRERAHKAGPEAPNVEIACKGRSLRMLGRLIALTEHRLMVADTIRAAKLRPAAAQQSDAARVISLDDRRRMHAKT